MFIEDATQGHFWDHSWEMEEILFVYRLLGAIRFFLGKLFVVYGICSQ